MPTARHLSDIYLDPTTRGAEPKAGQIGFVRMAVKSIDVAKRQIHFVCSTNEVDRYGEIVEPSAYAESIPGFMANPVFCAGHVYVAPDGKPTVIGEWKRVWVSEVGLEGIAEFDAVYPLAQDYWNLYQNGRMKAVSVGFIVHEFQMQERMIDGRKARVRVFVRVELIEISAVAIPANRAALVRAASATPGAVTDALIRRLEALVDRLERKAGADAEDLMTLPGDDDAEGEVGIGSLSDGYFGAIPEDRETPGDPWDCEGEDDDIMKALCEAYATGRAEARPLEQ